MTIERSSARLRAAVIRDLIETAADALERIPELVIEARDAGDWEALGYDDWESYVRGEYKTGLLRLAKSVRRQWVEKLSEAGMSTREIAPVVNTHKDTVRNDLRGENSPGRSTPEPEPGPPGDQVLEGVPVLTDIATTKARIGDVTDALAAFDTSSRRQRAAAWRSRYPDVESAHPTLLLMLESFKEAFGV